MEYNKTSGATFDPSRKERRHGMGLERVVAVLQGRPRFSIRKISGDARRRRHNLRQGVRQNEDDDRAMRIVVDHVRTAVFMIGDARGIVPSNVDQGYILRRLIRRAVRYGRQLGIEGFFTSKLREGHRIVPRSLSELEKNRDRVIGELDAEEDKFMRTLQNGLREVEKVKKNWKPRRRSRRDGFLFVRVVRLPKN